MIRRASLLVALALLAAAAPARADEGAVCADAAENGQKLRDKGHFTDARQLFSTCARKECPKLVRDDCLSFLDQLRKRMPSIVVRVADSAHHDVTSFKVLRDGKMLLDKPSGTAIDVDPGASTLHVEAEGFKPRDLPLVVAEGEQRRLVEIVLDPIKGSGSEPITPAPLPLPPPPAASGGPGAATWIAGGVGVVGLGVFGVFQGLAWSQHGQLFDLCGGAHMCSKDQVAPLQTKYDVSAIGLGIGAAGVVTAVILYLAVDRGSKPATAGRITPLGIRF